MIYLNLPASIVRRMCFISSIISCRCFLLDIPTNFIKISASASPPRTFDLKPLMITEKSNPMLCHEVTQ